MNNNLTIALRTFIYFSLVGGICCGIAFSIVSGSLSKGIGLGLLAGVLSSTGLSLYILFGLILFQKKWLFYANMPQQLQMHNVTNINKECVAGNATGVRIKYGGLFLTDNAILFISHRFALNTEYIEIPFKEIKEVRIASINLLKAYSGGLRKRLVIETSKTECYEFSIWDINSWYNVLNKIIHN